MDIILPKIALTMSSGIVQEWHRSVGDKVTKGEPLFTFETDKTGVDVEAPADGVLTEILVAAGEEAPAGTTIAILQVKGEAAKPSLPPDTHELSIAPAAAQLAEALGVDVTTVVGSGTGGRIIEADIIAAATPGARRTPAEHRAEAPAPAPASTAVTDPAVVSLGFSAARLASWATLERSAAVPTFQLGGRLDLGGRMADIRAARVSVLDVVALAAARALLANPTCHAHIRDGQPEGFTTPRIGILVRQGDALLTPTYEIHQQETAASLGARRRSVQQAITEGRMPAANSAAPTFVISNLGQFGVEWFTAMLFPGTAVTLAIGTIGAVGLGEAELAAVLTCDHRLADGVDAAQFMSSLREAIDAVSLT